MNEVIAPGAAVVGVCGASPVMVAGLLDAASEQLAAQRLDVVVARPEQELISRLALAHDLLLVTCSVESAMAKIWLASDAAPEPSVGARNNLLTIPHGEQQLPQLVSFLAQSVARAWTLRPILGGVLIGGKSTRMGSPKQLLPFRGSTLGEIVTGALREGIIAETDGAGVPHGDLLAILGGGGVAAFAPRFNAARGCAAHVRPNCRPAGGTPLEARSRVGTGRV